MSGTNVPLDTSRLGNAVRRPGVDPRDWIVFGEVEELGYDKTHGLFADVRLMPDGNIVTCLIGSSISTPKVKGWGGLRVGALVLVANPKGDASAGPVLLSVVNSASTPLPAELAENDDDSSNEPADVPTLVIGDGGTVRIVAKEGAQIKFDLSGGAKFEINAEGSPVEIHSDAAVIIDSPDVRLGDKAGPQVARLGDLVTGTVSALSAVPGAPIVIDPANAVPVPFLAKIVSGAAGVKS